MSKSDYSHVDVLEQVSSEQIRIIREKILDVLRVNNTPSIIGHAAIISLSDDLHTYMEEDKTATLDLVDTFFRQVELNNAREDPRATVPQEAN